jgi:curved DNA-binding protein CbpA
MQHKITLYDTLEVSPLASATVIRAAYRCLAQTNHPDRNLGATQANERISAINHAYSVLSDEEQRRRYDQSIALRPFFIERRGRIPAIVDRNTNSPKASFTECRPFAFRPLV